MKDCKMNYDPEDLLPISGIQHFLFCRRQWALIEIEKQWEENIFTIEGAQLHKRVDDPFENQSGPGLIVSRSIPVRSFTLGLTGVCDVVEFHQSVDGVNLAGHPGTWKPILIEYKRGSPKEGSFDEAQLCAQAMCLEEMLSIPITESYLYYGKTRHRSIVELNQTLRELIVQASTEMHQLVSKGYTPKAKFKKECKSCSLAEICVPTLATKVMSVNKYVNHFLEDEP